MKVYKPYSNKQIKGFEGLYYIYPNGEIKRQYKNHSRNLKPRIGKNGYIYFDLWKKHQGTRFYLHRLIAEHYLPKETGRDYVNHKDGNKLNNNIDNLEWCSAKENCIHKYKVLGYKKPPVSQEWRKKQSQLHLGKNKGKDNWKSQPVICAETGKIYSCYRECAEDIQGTVAGICDVIHGRCKKHRGLTFILMEK